MPMIRNPAAQALDWSSFPAPPPEAKDWEPNPDSIPRTGTLPDPRFGKDKWEESKLRNARKQFGYQLHHSSEAGKMTPPPSASSPSAAQSNRPPVGNLPQQAPRQVFQDHTSVATAHEFASMNLQAAPRTTPMASSLADTKTETISAAPAVQLPSSKTTKGTMETTATMPMPATLLTEKTTLPLWAGAIEKALAEDTSRTSSLPSLMPSKSVPPHLRKKLDSKSPSPQQKLPMASEEQTVSLDEQFHTVMEASLHVSSSLKADTETDEQISMSPSTVIETPTSSTNASYRDHGHYMKIRLVLMMEMDLLKQELMQLSDTDLEKRMMSLSSIHREWFEAHHDVEEPN